MFKTIFFAVLVFSVSAQAITDPTRPSTYQAASQAEKKLKLESILVAEDRKIAVINGVVVTEGDRVGSATVIAINRDSVRVNNNGNIINLMLAKVLIRQEK